MVTCGISKPQKFFGLENKLLTNDELNEEVFLQNIIITQERKERY
jgi:hypothetical protein